MVQWRMIYGCENVSSADRIFNTNFHETSKQKKERPQFEKTTMTNPSIYYNVRLFLRLNRVYNFRRLKKVIRYFL